MSVPSEVREATTRMRSFARLLASFLVAAAPLLVVTTAEAQPKVRPTPKGTTTTTTDYVEQRLDGDQVVKFTGDELVGPAGGAYGDLIRPLPGTIRVGLIRPRLNFVPELLKSVENL